MKNILKDIASFWAETWKDDKTLFFAEALGTLSSMFAAGLMSFQSPEPNLFIVFTFYIIGAVFLLYSNYIRKSSWMMVLMLFYTVVTTIGLVKLWL